MILLTVCERIRLDEEEWRLSTMTVMYRHVRVVSLEAIARQQWRRRELFFNGLSAEMKGGVPILCAFEASQQH